MDFSPFKGTRLRLVRLDDCGVVVTGTNAQFVTKGFISVEQAPEFEDGEEFVVKNANGDLCVNERDADRLKRINLTVTLCKVDPAAVELMTGAPVRTRSGALVGNEITSDANVTKFAMEIWNDLAGVACDANSQALYPRWVFPWVENGRLGNITHEYGAQNWVVTASTHANPNFGTGPFGEWVPALSDTTHGAYEVGLVAPPDDEVGYQAV